MATDKERTGPVKRGRCSCAGRNTSDVIQPAVLSSNPPVFTSPSAGLLDRALVRADSAAAAAAAKILPGRVRRLAIRPLRPFGLAARLLLQIGRASWRGRGCRSV